MDYTAVYLKWISCLNRIFNLCKIVLLTELVANRVSEFLTTIAVQNIESTERIIKIISASRKLTYNGWIGYIKHTTLKEKKTKEEQVDWEWKA